VGLLTFFPFIFPFFRLQISNFSSNFKNLQHLFDCGEFSLKKSFSFEVTMALKNLFGWKASSSQHQCVLLSKIEGKSERCDGDQQLVGQKMMCPTTSDREGRGGVGRDKEARDFQPGAMGFHVGIGGHGGPLGTTSL
jgi:hypothetical protein